jgi:hypothetical protein
MILNCRFHPNAYVEIYKLEDFIYCYLFAINAPLNFTNILTAFRENVKYLHLNQDQT